MTPNEFEAQLRELLREHAEVVDNAGCLACERCERCTDSTFLKDCTNVARSNYCERCVDCTECGNTKDSKNCFGCMHCERCEGCTQCAYCVRSTNCSGCTYCFGCVGLSKKDFHILNEPYERQEWFRIVGELRKAMRL